MSQEQRKSACGMSAHIKEGAGDGKRGGWQRARRRNQKVRRGLSCQPVQTSPDGQPEQISSPAIAWATQGRAGRRGRRRRYGNYSHCRRDHSFAWRRRLVRTGTLVLTWSSSSDASRAAPARPVGLPRRGFFAGMALASHNCDPKSRQTAWIIF